MNLSKPLVNLAILETLKTNDCKDEIDLFIPYVAVSIAHLKEIPFSATDLKNQLKMEFGIDAPAAAIDVLMARAKKRDLLRIENHVYFPVSENIKPWSEQYAEGVDRVDESLGLVAKEFIEFSDSKYNKKISEDEAIDFIYDFLRENIGDSALISIDRREINSSTIKNQKHLTASFIAHIYATKSELRPNFEMVTRAIMLAGYLGYANQIVAKSDYRKITVYLDTPIILGLLGYSGDSKLNALLEMINMLQKFKIDLAIFDVTVREVEGVLRAWATGLQTRNYGKFNLKTLELLKHKKIDHIALETELALLERKIEKFGLRIHRGFKLIDRYNCDLQALEAKIKSEYNGNKDTRHDADVLNRVLNSRKGQRVNKLSQEFSIFITPNTTLVEIGQEFFGDLDRTIPYAATDRWLTTMFWFKHPDIFKDLPTRMLLSSAYGTMLTENGFWRRFSERLEGLQKKHEISEEDFILVRHDTSLLLRVHELSVDRGMEFTDRDVFDVVEDIKQKNLAEKDSEIERLNHEYSGKISELEAKSISAEERFVATNSHLDRLSNVIATILASVVTLTLAAIILWVSFTALLDQISPTAQKSSSELSVAAILAILVTAFFGFAGTVWGLSVVNLYQILKENLLKKISKFLKGAI